MTSTAAYGTVVAGERIEDTTPLIATGYSTELHAADVVPMYYRPSGPIGGPISNSSTYQGNDTLSQMRIDAPDDRDPFETCAMIGCLFSWIPIVGLVTGCINRNAREVSATASWARTALMTPTVSSRMLPFSTRQFYIFSFIFLCHLCPAVMQIYE